MHSFLLAVKKVARVFSYSAIFSFVKNWIKEFVFKQQKQQHNSTFATVHNGHGPLSEDVKNNEETTWYNS